MIRGFLRGAVASLLFAIPMSAQAAGDISISKAAWTSVNPATQTAIVIGALSGYEAGIAGGTSASRNGWKKHDDASVQPARFSKTYAFYQTAINDFYISHPDSGAVPIGVIVGCLADGTTTATCESILRKFPQ